MAQKRKAFTLKNYRHPDQYGDWLGYQVGKLDRKKRQAILTLILRDEHLSLAGRVHGGVVAGFLDFACGAAVFTTLFENDFCSTVELKVNYFRPLFSADKLRCVSKVVFRGKRLCVVHAYLYRQREKDPVAMATATFNVVDGTKPTA